jgi:arginase
MRILSLLLSVGVIPSLEASASSLYRFSAHPHTCSIVGAPMTYGQPNVGTDMAPQMLRDAGLRSMLSALNWRVEDLLDLDFEQFVDTVTTSGTSGEVGRARNPHIVGPGTELLANIVAEKLKQGRFPLILGGDHSIGIGSLAGILHTVPDTGVIWVDAHADLNTPAISESGNMHGMPLGMLMEGVCPKESVPGFEWLQETYTTRLSPKNLVYVGLRDVDPAERDLIHSLGIAAFTMHDIDRYGIGTVMEMALEHLLASNPNRPLHLSYDIDAVDPILAPATGTAVRGGLTFREAHFVAEAVARSGNLASAEIVELNPTLSNDVGAADTIELGLQIITSLMGKSII